MAGPGADARRARIDWDAVGAGAARGLLFIVPVVGFQLLAARGSDDDLSGGLVGLLFVGILLAFAAAGSRAGRQGSHAPRAHGALAGVFALLAWLPLRIVVAALTDSSNPLRGIGAAAVFAVGMGAIGGVWGAHRARMNDPHG